MTVESNQFLVGQPVPDLSFQLVLLLLTWMLTIMVRVDQVIRYRVVEMKTNASIIICKKDVKLDQAYETFPARKKEARALQMKSNWANVRGLAEDANSSGKSRFRL